MATLVILVGPVAVDDGSGGVCAHTTSRALNGVTNKRPVTDLQAAYYGYCQIQLSVLLSLLKRLLFNTKASAAAVSLTSIRTLKSTPESVLG